MMIKTPGKSLLASSIIAANAMFVSGYAPLSFAQEEVEDVTEAPSSGLPIEEVVVTASGFRGSLEAALDVKRESVGAVDSIMAEDIADFPDNNLAESLQRIPGIAISREGGEGREITVRGLDASYTSVMINDAMGQSLAAGSGGVRTSRAFDFNVFASELFNRIDVYKTQSAELEEGSLGATVNLHTGRPFDYEPLTVALNIQETYNDQSTELKPRGSGLFSWTNEDETFGALFSASADQKVTTTTGVDTGRWTADEFGSCSACETPADVAAVTSAQHPRFPRMMDKVDEQDRYGLTAAFQFRPTESTTVTIDALRANVQSSRSEPFMEAISLARTGDTGVDETDVAAYTLDPNNTMTSATMDGVDVRSESFDADWESEFTQYGINLEQYIGDNLKVNVMYSTSESVLDNRETTLIYEHFSDGDTRKALNYADNSSALTYDMSNQHSPSLDYSFDTTDPANWEVSEFRDRIYDASTESDSLKLDAEYILTDIFTLKAGLSSREYDYKILGTRADLAFSDADASDGVVDNSACGISNTVTAADGSVKTYGGQTFFIPGAAQYAQFQSSACWPATISANDDRAVTEEATGYYLQLDYDTEISGHRFRGNVGVRQVETELKARGVNGGQTITATHDYDDTLPSINMAYNLTDDLVLRASWAEVMSRPNLTTLNPGGSVTTFGDPAVSYGNPFIEPFRAKNTDLSVEWYFDEGALLSVAYFYKAIESFPTSEKTRMSWQETGQPDSVLGAQRDDLIDEEFEVTSAINGGGGMLDGWEFQYQQNMSFLPQPWMQNIGFIGNVTIVDSEVDATGEQLEGQSDLSYNLTVYYEDDKFSTRLAYTYRDEYITNNDDDNDDVRYRDETGNLDFSAAYQINDNFRVSLEGINLTDEPVTDYMAPGIGRIITEQQTGTQWALGLSYKY